MLNPALSQNDLQTYVANHLTGIADPTQVVVSLTRDTSTPGVTMAQVSAVYQHTIAVPGLPSYTLYFRPDARVPV